MSTKWTLTAIDVRPRGGTVISRSKTYNAGKALIASCVGPATSAAAHPFTGLTTHFPNHVYGARVIGSRTISLARGLYKFTPGTSYTTSALRMTSMSAGVVAKAGQTMTSNKLIIEFIGD